MLDETCSHGIRMDIAANLDQILVGGDVLGFEGPFKESATLAIAVVESSRVSAKDGLGKFADRDVTILSNQIVIVIGQ